MNNVRFYFPKVQVALLVPVTKVHWGLYPEREIMILAVALCF